MHKPGSKIRLYTPQDVPAMARLFAETIRSKAFEVYCMTKALTASLSPRA